MAFFKKTINSVLLQGETVLLRADYNVPLNKDGTIADDLRIRASLPTIQKLLQDNCKVVIISHLGRPEGRDPKLSLEPAALRLSELLGEPVRFVDETIGDKPRMAIKRAPMRSVIMLENLRFYSEEEANDENFAKKLAETSGARFFVQDGFGVVHRAHASTDAITHYLPAVSGLLLEREYVTITDAMKAPKRPLVAVMGGAKVSDKIKVIDEFIKVADYVVIGGAMANTFFVEKGFSMGKSKYEEGEGETIAAIYKAANGKFGEDKVNEFFVLPSDLAAGKSLEPTEPRINRDVDGLEADDIALDIGDQSIEDMVKIVEKAGTVVWNGTLGMAELPNFAHGSARLGLTLASHPEITSIVGGGDTADFVLNWDAKKGGSFSHVSTGGGASLDLMAGEKLPGVESLLDA